jgi:tripeptidyl-peptidase-2
MGGYRFGRRELDPGERARLWLATPSADDLPDDAKPGDVLFGSMTFGEEGTDRPGAGRRPDGWPITMTVAPEGDEDEPAPEASDDEPKDERGPLEKLAETVRDDRLAALEKLGDDEDDAFRTLAAQIETDWPDWLPLWTARLARVDDDEGKGDTKAILAAADEVIARVDTTALAAWFGVQADDDDPAVKKESKEKKETRDALRDALLRRARALEVAAGEKPDDEERAAAADGAWDRLQRWADMDSDEIGDLELMRAERQGRLGTALELVNGRLDDAEKPDEDLRKTRLEVLEQLGWTHWVENERRALVVDFPPEKLMF